MRKLTAAAALLLMTAACSGAPQPRTTATGVGVRWTQHPDDPSVLLEPAKRLAAEIVAGDACRAQLQALPGWPVGDLPVRPVREWPEGYADAVAARTVWRDESDEHYPIPPRVEILERVIVSRSVAAVAVVLIHETVHAATGPADYEGDDEALARRIAGLCARAHKLLYVPRGVAEN